jgi:hypothetical protein
MNVWLCLRTGFERGTMCTKEEAAANSSTAAAVDANLQDDLTRIKNFLDREDSIKYCKILSDVLKCFGYGIIDSLEYTMKHYIK